MAWLQDLFRGGNRRKGGPPAPFPAPVGTWPAATEGRRVVVEHEDSAWQTAAARILETAGYEVACCGGPLQLPQRRCSLAVDHRCPLVESADLVINGLGISDPVNRDVLIALRARCDQSPVIVAEIPPPQLADAPVEIAGFRTIPVSVGSRDLVAAVDDILHSRAGSPARSADGPRARSGRDLRP